jgi:hypothetical protein
MLLMLALTGMVILSSGCTTVPPSNTTTPVPTVTATPTTLPENVTACTQDADCVPAECCHPTSCINAAYKGVCTKLCTQVCEGPIDCGAGH